MLETFQLSNDAFYYLKDGDEPLLDEAIDEALVVEALFPDGYTIFDYRLIGDTGYIEARIGPKTRLNAKPRQLATVKANKPLYDEAKIAANSKNYADSNLVMPLSKIYRVELVWLDTEQTKVRAYTHKLHTGERKLWGDFDVLTQSNGLKYFQETLPNKTFTRLYLKHFNKI